MENKITLSDLIGLLAEQTNISNSESEVFLKTLFDIITETLSKDDVVKIKDFGTFKLTPIQARESIDVNSGEKIEILAHNRLNFAPATALKELVNKPFSHFETVLLDEGVVFDGISEVVEVDELEENEIKFDQVSKLTDEMDILTNIETHKRKEVFPSNRSSYTKLYKHTKLSPVWIPILGGVAVALVSLFFSSTGRK